MFNPINAITKLFGRPQDNTPDVIYPGDMVACWDRGNDTVRVGIMEDVVQSPYWYDGCETEPEDAAFVHYTDDARRGGCSLSTFDYVRPDDIMSIRAFMDTLSLPDCEALAQEVA